MRFLRLSTRILVNAVLLTKGAQTHQLRQDSRRRAFDKIKDRRSSNSLEMVHNRNSDVLIQHTTSKSANHQTLTAVPSVLETYTSVNEALRSTKYGADVRDHWMFRMRLS